MAEENLRLKHEIAAWKAKYKELEDESMELDSLMLEKEDLQKEIKSLQESLKGLKEKEIIDLDLNVLLMEETQKGTEQFIVVYIDDILVFSESEEKHEKHLRVMLKIWQDNGLVLSPTKMKIAVKEIEFLEQYWETEKSSYSPT
ncbi:hypothetical protein ZIOFF_051235 [Zingiber officinale]|uniref:Reverse transcriptase domain-containing protein n=1 Tax=Zingiber officinale TaxID=94328 RepID=A0A8J5FME0_ZINOF|nr:hypothetical protein ZIOFF_051235 [Zingiber officinale]